MEITEKSLVVQSNSLINAKYEMTLPELRIVFCALASIDNQSKNITEFSIPFSTLVSGANITAIYENADNLEDSCKKIRTIVTQLERRTFEIYNEKDPGWHIFNWVYDAFVSIDRKEVCFKINEKLIPHLLDLKTKFTSVELGVLLRLRSFAQIRLYLLLREHLYIGNRKIPLLKLKELLKVNDKYPSFGNFKQIILDRAQKRFSEVADIIFTYKKNNVGKKVTDLLFYIKLNPNKKQIRESFKSGKRERLLIDSTLDNTALKLIDTFLERLNNQFEEFNKNIKHTIEERRDIITKVYRRLGSEENWYEYIGIWFEENISKAMSEALEKQLDINIAAELAKQQGNIDIYFNQMIPLIKKKLTL